MSDLNFAMVKMSHNTWRLKLRGFLDGREQIDPMQLASHQGCELGKWIYSVGLSKHGQLHDMQELEKKHKIMHGVVRRVVELKSAGKAQEAEQEFLKVKEAADTVVSLLTNLEKQIK
jgi:methyl-accepting chemotaxis protein